jgi:HK97 family phage prohead protease
MKLYTKAFVDEIDKDHIVAIASSDIEDRQGEVVDVGGWELENFIKAPRLLWGHEHKRLPVGKVTKIWVEKSANSPKLMFKAEFQTVTKFGRAVKKLFEQGFLNTFSVGFKPIDSEYDDDVKSGTRFTKQELLEISVVNVPANPDALTLAYKSLEEDGFEEQASKIFGEPTIYLVKEVDKLKDRISAVEEIANNAVKGLKFLNPQGRSQLAKNRASMLKIIERSSSGILSEQHEATVTKRVKVIKKATDQLIRSNKELLWED